MRDDLKSLTSPSLIQFSLVPLFTAGTLSNANVWPLQQSINQYRRISHENTILSKPSKRPRSLAKVDALRWGGSHSPWSPPLNEYWTHSFTIHGLLQSNWSSQSVCWLEPLHNSTQISVLHPSKQAQRLYRDYHIGFLYWGILFLLSLDNIPGSSIPPKVYNPVSLDWICTAKIMS